ncbi:hypothetical protein HMI56_005343 [Coelomomyces lativittatus]|nr:hypothetical protein HMI56_005343 [Coelomomyces lativittatus]
MSSSPSFTLFTLNTLEQSLSELDSVSSSSMNSSQRFHLSILIPEVTETHTQTLSNPPSLTSPKSSTPLSSLLPLLETTTLLASSSSTLFLSPEKDEFKDALVSLTKLEEEQRNLQRKPTNSLSTSCSSILDTFKVHATTQTCPALFLSGEGQKDQMAEDLIHYAEGALFGLDGQVIDASRAFRLLCLAAERYHSHTVRC